MDELGESTFEHDLSAVAELLRAHNLPSPSEVFLQNLTSEVKKDDVFKMMDSQSHMLQRFEKTNEMLSKFNTLSASRYETTSQEFLHHTQLLAEMKKDLDNVFRRIRGLKIKLNKHHPEAFKACSMKKEFQEEDEEEQQEESQEVQTRSHPHPRPSRPHSVPPPIPPRPLVIGGSPRQSPGSLNSLNTSSDSPVHKGVQSKTAANAEPSG